MKNVDLSDRQAIGVLLQQLCELVCGTDRERWELLREMLVRLPSKCFALASDAGTFTALMSPLLLHELMKHAV